MIIFLITLLLLILFVFLFIQQPKFGKLPSGERLQQIKNSPHYKNKSFQNLSHTPSLAEGETFTGVLRKWLFTKNSNKKPGIPVPSVKTNLHEIDIRRNILVWFGHSSYYMQLDGKRILVDPVLHGSASPLPNGTKAFPGADIYKTGDIPNPDFLFITHDHWDHLDYKTVKELKPRIGKIICSLGTGAHLEHWGFKPGSFIEKDWNEFIDLGEGFSAYTTPSRHFSGRSLWRNKSMWTSYAFQTPHHKIFIGGDSGYDDHFADIGKKFGPFDLAILENGQYNESWKYIHMMPEEAIKAAYDLGAKKLLPVHSGKFALSLHDWDEPLSRITTAPHPGLNIATPMIGEILDLDDPAQTFKKWWEKNEA
jgi:L-ascorbate metabolism protein UlaG (beta-lactamase superfamily)